MCSATCSSQPSRLIISPGRKTTSSFPSSRAGLSRPVQPAAVPIFRRAAAGALARRSLPHRHVAEVGPDRRDSHRDHLHRRLDGHEPFVVPLRPSDREQCRTLVQMKLAPMLRGTTSLTRLFPMRSRDGLDSLLYKERADGRGAIQISGANSATVAGDNEAAGPGRPVEMGKQLRGRPRDAGRQPVARGRKVSASV